MKKQIIIEEVDIICLSEAIAESIIAHSEKFYGFRMLSRSTQAEISNEEMMEILTHVIRKAVRSII